MDFPDEAVVEDTTRLRDKQPEASLELEKATKAAPVETTEPEIEEDELNIPLQDSKPRLSNVEKPLTEPPQQLSSAKTSADIRKTLDSFFNE